MKITARRLILVNVAESTGGRTHDCTFSSQIFLRPYGSEARRGFCNHGTILITGWCDRGTNFREEVSIESRLQYLGRSALVQYRCTNYRRKR